MLQVFIVVYLKFSVLEMFNFYPLYMVLISLLYVCIGQNDNII